MISRLFTTTFSVQRPEWSEDSAGLAELDDVQGHLQQARPELTQQLGLAMTKTYIIWFPVDADIQEGDRLICGEDSYSVRAVQTNNYGQNPHLEVIAEKHG
jgi:hypothetical protein